jgi:hypothetical protein
MENIGGVNASEYQEISRLFNQLFTITHDLPQ